MTHHRLPGRALQPRQPSVPGELLVVAVRERRRSWSTSSPSWLGWSPPPSRWPLTSHWPAAPCCVRPGMAASPHSYGRARHPADDSGVPPGHSDVHPVERGLPA